MLQAVKTIWLATQDVVGQKDDVTERGTTRRQLFFNMGDREHDLSLIRRNLKDAGVHVFGLRVFCCLIDEGDGALCCFRRNNELLSSGRPRWPPPAQAFNHAGH